MSCATRSGATRSVLVAAPLLALGTALALLPSAAFAVEPLDTFNFRIGGYFNKFDTEVRADGETERGTNIDLHRDLGLDENKTIGVLGLSWRPWEHHEFALSYYQDSADSTRQLSRDIVFNGTTYEANATVRTEVDIDGYELSYNWWPALHDTWALGPRFGLVWYKLDLGLSLELDANGNQAGSSVSNSVSADLPAPSIGGSWRWTPADQWRVSADIGYFQADINDIDAHVTYGRGGVEWYPWENWGFWMDYTITRIDADANKSRFTGNLDFRDTGGRLGITYRF